MISDLARQGLVMSEEYKFIFLHFYKTGGNSIASVLKQKDIFKGDVERQLTAEECVEYGLTTQKPSARVRHLSALEARRLMSEDVWKAYFKCAFVRNPWDWMVSLYHFHIQNEVFRSRRPNTYEETLRSGGFRSWVKGYFWDKMFALKFLCDENGILMVDFVGRYENLQGDFDRICDRVGMPRILLPHKNRSEHEHYSRYYDDEVRELVRKRFCKEIEMFGYEFEQETR